MSEAVFDPDTHTITVWATPDEVTLGEDGEFIQLEIMNVEGIEIVHEDDRIWRPA